MRIWRSLGLVALAAAMLTPLARAQSDEEKKEETRRQRIRKELVEKLDKRLQEFRNEMIEEIDRAVARRSAGGGERTTRPQPGAGDRPLLGVTLKPLSEGARTLLDLPEGVGVMVDEVREGSAAEKAGIQKGDILLAWNGETIHGPEDLGRLVKGAKPGDKVKLTVLHRGAKQDLEATLGSAPGAAEPTPEAEGDEGKTGPREGEGLEDFLERVLKDGEKDGEKKEEGERPTTPFSFGGDPKQLEDLMKQFFGGDP
ncbi:MAG: PDZ domain-containing protein, partial [Planctomycetes bacterium]|nr:PDZ domain-containing protein [Planctomycetota bacterium]